MSEANVGKVEPILRLPTWEEVESARAPYTEEVFCCLLYRAAQQGAGMLDKAFPRWWKGVSTSYFQLDITSCVGCILGQVFGDHLKGQKALGLDSTNAWTCGFALPNNIAAYPRTWRNQPVQGTYAKAGTLLLKIWDAEINSRANRARRIWERARQRAIDLENEGEADAHRSHF